MSVGKGLCRQCWGLNYTRIKLYTYRVSSGALRPDTLSCFLGEGGSLCCCARMGSTLNWN